MLDGDFALVCEVLDVCLAVFLPVLDVLVGPDAQGTASEDDGADVVVEAGGADGFFVGLRCCENVSVCNIG